MTNTIRKKENWCVSQIWSLKFYDPNNLEKQNQNYYCMKTEQI